MTLTDRHACRITFLPNHLLSICFTGGGAAAGIDRVTRGTTFSVKEVTTNENGQWCSERIEVSYVVKESDQEIFIFEGCWPRIERLLIEAGYTLEFANNRRIADSNIADPGEVQRLSTMNQHLIQLIIRNLLLRLCVRSEYEINDHLELICRLFPHAEIVVLAKTKRHSSKIRRQLIRRLGQPVRRGGDLNGDLDARITVGPPTTKTLSLITMPIILVALDVDDLLNKSGGKFLSSQILHYRFDRIIGFQSDIKQRPHPEMYREGIFGPKQYPTPRRRRQVLVAFAQAPGQDELPHTDALERKCRRIWCSGVRNDRVVSLASAIAHGQIWKLERSGIHPEVIQYLGRPFIRVVILVENLAHAQELQCRLTGWSILAEGGSTPGAPSQNGNIATIAYADRHGVDGDVVIQAAGGVDTVPRPWLRPASEAGVESPIVVIDLHDQIPADLERQTQERKLRHQQQGYRVLDPRAASHDAY